MLISKVSYAKYLLSSDGRLLIELRGDGDRGRWMSAPSNKVYWPPGPATSLTTGSPGLLSSRLDSTASQHTTGEKRRDTFHTVSNLGQ